MMLGHLHLNCLLRRVQCLDFAKKFTKGTLFVEVAELKEVVNDSDKFAFAATVER